MGTSQSSINDEDGNRKQIDEKSQEMYKLVSLKGGGELVEMTRVAIKTNIWTDLEDKLQSDDVKRFMHCDGRGKDIPIKSMVAKRHQERGAKSALVTEDEDEAGFGSSNKVFPGITGRHVFKSVKCCVCACGKAVMQW